MTTITRERVDVGGFVVDALPRARLRELIVARWSAPDRQQATVVYACHIGGLNAAARDPLFTDALRSADIVYADGISVSILVAVAGGLSSERHPTTDLGWEVIQDVSLHLGRPARIAVIGGPVGLADRAGRVLAERGRTQCVLAEAGFQDEWSGVLDRVADERPDVLIVGMGMPLEAIWVRDHLSRLPPETLVLTCGGWMNFIVGDEVRAASWAQRAGLEWAARLAQAPQRLAWRYLSGIATCSRLAMGLAGQRVRTATRTREAVDGRN